MTDVTAAVSSSQAGALRHKGQMDNVIRDFATAWEIASGNFVRTFDQARSEYLSRIESLQICLNIVGLALGPILSGGISWLGSLMAERLTVRVAMGTVPGAASVRTAGGRVALVPVPPLSGPDFSTILRNAEDRIAMFGSLQMPGGRTIADRHRTSLIAVGALQNAAQTLAGGLLPIVLTMPSGSTWSIGSDQILSHTIIERELLNRLNNQFDAILAIFQALFDFLSTHDVELSVEDCNRMIAPWLQYWTAQRTQLVQQPEMVRNIEVYLWAHYIKTKRRTERFEGHWVATMAHSFVVLRRFQELGIPHGRLYSGALPIVLPEDLPVGDDGEVLRNWDALTRWAEHVPAPQLLQ